MAGSEAGSGLVKESEKKERGPSRNEDMMWRRRGVLVEGHVEWQMVVQRVSFEAREWSWEETQEAEARVAPSKRVKI